MIQEMSMYKPKKLEFTSFRAGILFFVLVGQFQRVSDEIKKVHDGLLAGNVDKDKAQETLDYYQKEKSIVLAEMAKLLVNDAKVKE